MEIASSNGFLHKSADFEQSGFTIKASAKAFTILSNSLYQNKIRAIIRELSCNAIDAQMEAGSDRPFEWHLPNHGNPNFRIRDFGTGISPENIKKVYTTYFESTKTGSNDFIGCLGLGSKTPFCYTDNFIVNSYYEGVLRSYACAIDSHGMPVVALVSESPTNQPSGLEIQFSVKSADFSRFITEATFVYYFLNNKPAILGDSLGNGSIKVQADSLGSMEVLAKGSDWVLAASRDQWGYARNTPISKSMVIMGNVPYELTPGNIPNLTLEETTLISGGGGSYLHLFVPIGAVEPQASRESLSYSKDTIKFLQAKLAEIIAEIKKDFEQKVSSCDSYINAFKLVVSLKKEITTEPLRSIHRSIVFNGKTISESFPFSQARASGGHLYIERLKKHQRYGRRGNPDSIIVKMESEASFASGIVSSLFVSADSLKNHPKSTEHATSIVKRWFQESPDHGVGSSIYFVTKEIADYLELKDGVDIFDYDKLPVHSRPAVARAPRKYRTEGKKKSDVWIIASNKEAEKHTVDFDTDDDMYYVKVENKKPVGADFHWMKFNIVSRYRKEQILGLTERQIVIVENLPNWHEVSKDFEEIVKEVFSTKLAELEKDIEAVRVANSRHSAIFAVIGGYYRMNSLNSVSLFNITNRRMFDLLYKKDPNHELIQLGIEYCSTANTAKTSVLLELGNALEYWYTTYDAEIKVLKSIITKVEADLLKRQEDYAAREAALQKKYPALTLHNEPSEELISQIVDKCL